MLIDQEGRFAGHASIFGIADQGGDIVMPGAFARSLQEKGRDRIRLLFQHDPKRPVGRIVRLFEDDRGLRVEGQLLTDVPAALSLRNLVAGGALDGLSIGFRTVRATRDRASGLRRLWQVDLWEISLVTFPMMERARIADAGGSAASDQLRQRMADAIGLVSAH